MKPETEAAIVRATGGRPVRVAPLSGGCVGDVRKVTLNDGRVIVAKVGDRGGGLALEGFMLEYLDRAGLPVPKVLHAESSLLLMTWIEHDGWLTRDVQRHAAEIVARLHDITGAAYGFERDTVIGGLPQPNPPSERWLPFFREQRLLYMAGQAHAAGRLPKRLLARLEALAGRLERWIKEPPRPSLIHGDLWTGNILCKGGRIAGFVDPAIYYGDPEIELAFSTLFATFDEAFFDCYRELRPLRAGFFEERRDLYNLYPLLVHVRLFGGSYLGSLERTLAKFGC